MHLNRIFIAHQVCISTHDGAFAILQSDYVSVDHSGNVRVTHLVLATDGYVLLQTRLGGADNVER